MGVTTSLDGLKLLLLASHAWDAGTRRVGAGGYSIHLWVSGGGHTPVVRPRRSLIGRGWGWGWGADLGLHVVSHIVGCAAQRDLPDRPWGIIGQIGRQDTDPQLALGWRHRVRGSRASQGQGQVGPGRQEPWDVALSSSGAGVGEGQLCPGRSQNGLLLSLWGSCPFPQAQLGLGMLATGERKARPGGHWRLQTKGPQTAMLGTEKQAEGARAALFHGQS